MIKLHHEICKASGSFMIKYQILFNYQFNKVGLKRLQ